MIKTMQELAHDAEEVQNASNMRGVVFSLHTDVIPSLRKHGLVGSYELSHHPIVYMFICKLADMAGMIYGTSNIDEAKQRQTELDLLHNKETCKMCLGHYLPKGFLLEW